MSACIVISGTEDINLDKLLVHDGQDIDNKLLVISEALVSVESKTISKST